MQDQLHLALIQTHLHWENPVANRSHFTQKILEVSGDIDIIVLPEMFTTGFSMNAQPLAETMEGDTLYWLKELSKQKEIAICGSIMITENDTYYNRFVFVTPDGHIEFYDKRHTFNMAGEGDVFEQGQEKIIVNYLGWKLCLQVCYDLRFPVFARNVEEYDVLLYVANWPKPRVAAWDALLKARAIENMCYTIGVNRIGLDGNGLEYVGHSGVYNVLGEEIAFAKAQQEIITTTLSKNHIIQTRTKLPFLKDKDQFKIL